MKKATPNRLERPREIDLVRATAATAVTPERRDRIRGLAAGDLNWTLVFDTAESHGTMPLVYRNLNECAGDIVSGPILAGLRESYRQNSLNNLALTGELRRVVDLCCRQEIRLLPFKGPTLAVLAYGDLSLRSFVDLDLLVRPEDFERAFALLCSADCCPCYALSKDERRYHVATRKEIPLRGRHSALIELHIQPTDDAYRLPLGFDELWSRRQSVIMAGQDFWTFGMEDLCLLLAVHGSAHWWGCLKWICDYAQLLRPDVKIDWERIVETSRRMRCEFMILLAASMAQRVLDAPLPVPLAIACESNRHVASLAAELEKRLFSVPQQRWGILREARYHLCCQGRICSTLWFFSQKIFMPHMTDWQFVKLPRPLWFLYSILRPLRLVAKRVRALWS